MWKLQWQAFYVVGLLLFASPKTHAASKDFVNTPPLSGEIISRCEDRTARNALWDGWDASCPPLGTGELQKQYQAMDETETWDSWQWGPLEMSESELSLLYRPGERHPLWGY